VAEEGKKLINQIGTFQSYNRRFPWHLFDSSVSTHVDSSYVFFTLRTVNTPSPRVLAEVPLSRGSQPNSPIRGFLASSPTVPVKVEADQ